MLLWALILGAVATGHAWVLEANVDDVTPGHSRDVQLTCRHDYGTTTATTNGNSLATLDRIRITKLDPFGSQSTFASMRHQTNVTSRVTHDAYTVEGRVDALADAFIKVTWPVATTETAGAYGCHVDGFDLDNNFVSLQVESKFIREKVLTIEDINKHIQTATSGYEKKQQELEAEVAGLKSLFQNELNSLRQEMTNQALESKKEIKMLKDLLYDTFAMKSELSEGISALKNFTKDEILSDNQDEFQRHAILLMSIGNVNKSTSDKITKLTTDFSNANSLLDDKIGNSDRKNARSIQELNSTLTTLDLQRATILRGLGNDIVKLQTLLEKKISDAVCKCATTTTPTTTTTTTTTTTPKRYQRWPEGAYRLPKPASGCPISYPSQSEIPSDYADRLFFNTRIIQTKNTSRSDGLDLVYCQRKHTHSTRADQWPQGSYCLGRFTSQCPQGFQTGSFRTRVRKLGAPAKTKDITSYYCCRSDGKASTLIDLPTEQPFYLYRYKGACQAVTGMKVRSEGIKVSLQWLVILTASNSSAPTPDTKKLPFKETLVSLCYYY